MTVMHFSDDTEADARWIQLLKMIYLSPWAANIPLNPGKKQVALIIYQVQYYGQGFYTSVRLCVCAYQVCIYAASDDRQQQHFGGKKKPGGPVQLVQLINCKNIYNIIVE